MRAGVRLGTALVSMVLVGGGAGLTAAPAQAEIDRPDHTGLVQGGNWLAKQVDYGGVVRDVNGNADWGLGLEVARALRASGGHDDDVTRIENSFLDYGAGYLDLDYQGDGARITGRSANATARTLAYLQIPSVAAGQNVGGVDVKQRLESLTLAASPVAGRIADESHRNGAGTPDPSVDTADTAGQAYAAYALSRTRSTKAASALTFLLKQQCSDGGFRPSFTASKSATEQSCVAPADADVPTTAIALHQLDQIVVETQAISTAKTAAAAYLAAAQLPDGSWSVRPGAGSADSRSTGLAASAVGNERHPDEARRGAVWLRSHQITAYNLCDRLGGSYRGAIAPDVAAETTGRASGMATDVLPRWKATSAETVSALRFVPEDTTPTTPVLSGRAGYLKAGTVTKLTVTGSDADDKLCLRGTSTAVQFAGAPGSVVRSVTLPAGTATREYTLWDPDGGSATINLSVLGTTKLTLTRSASKVKRTKYLGITVKGLAPGEKAHVVYAGRTVKSGTATEKGTLYARFPVGKTVTTRTVRAYGQFNAIRTGATTVKVVR